MLIESFLFRKQAEIDRKKAEVRARLEAQAAGKKAKKGFMTPERKKKLRVSSFLIFNLGYLLFTGDIFSCF